MAVLPPPRPPGTAFGKPVTRAIVAFFCVHCCSDRPSGSWRHRWLDLCADCTPVETTHLPIVEER